MESAKSEMGWSTEHHEEGMSKYAKLRECPSTQNWKKNWKIYWKKNWKIWRRGEEQREEGKNMKKRECHEEEGMSKYKQKNYEE